MIGYWDMEQLLRIAIMFQYSTRIIWTDDIFIAFYCYNTHPYVPIFQDSWVVIGYWDMEQLLRLSNIHPYNNPIREPWCFWIYNHRFKTGWSGKWKK